MAVMDRMKKGFLRHKKKNNQQDSILEETQQELFDLEEQLANEKQDFVKKKIKQNELTVDDYVEQLIDSTHNLEQKKREYEQVTAYLTDIQLIDQITGEERKSVEAVAYKLADLSYDREKLQKENKALSQLQFRFMQLHEYEIEDGIKHMAEQEAYQNDIHEDLRKLEEEKINLQYEEKYYYQRLHNLKTVAITAILLAIIGLGIIAYLYTQYIFDVFTSVLLLLVVLAILGTVIFMKYRNINYALAYCGKQQNRASKLINKVKIKYVNNTATMDYLCEKYNVGSSRELEYMWNQYQTILQNEQRYKHASKELNHYGNLLSKVLQKVGVHDSEVWLSQPEALLDSREMVEVTHNLNVRRGQLREEMEVDEDVIDLAIYNIREHIEAHPEDAAKIRQLLAPYRIRM